MSNDARVPEVESEHPAEPTSSAAKRRRIGLACNNCRTRKTKCNGERPACSTCLALHFDCHYEPTESSTNVIVRKEYMSDLDQRVVSLETVVQRLDDTLRGHLNLCIDRPHPGRGMASHPSPLSVARPQASIGTHRSRASNLEEPEDENVPTDGMALIFVDKTTSSYFGESSNIGFTRLLLHALAAVRQTAMGVQAPPDKEYTIVENDMARCSRAWSNPTASSPGKRNSSMMELPPVKEMDAMLETYFGTTGLLFPFIHEETWRQTYADCRANGFIRVRRTWLGLLNMIFALATTTSCDRVDTVSARECIEESTVFYDRAVSLCGEVSKRVMNLEIVHYLLLVALYCQGTRRSVQAWNIHGFLVRSAMALGLHVSHTHAATKSHHEESCCRTWLTIYCLDKVLSMTFGRPAAIPDEHMASRQPASWPSLSNSVVSDESTDISGEFLGVSFRLYQVMGRSLVRQYGANSGRKDLELDDTASLQAAGEIREALRVWASNLPVHWQLCESHSIILQENTPANRLRVILTLRYHNISILVHRPLLASTLRRLFLKGATKHVSPAYLFQLTMAVAHECTRSAESTVDIVHSVLSADRTRSNNLGVWFFTLYYVFTASLVLSGRLLWAQYGQGTTDATTAAHTRHLLQKVQTIFQQLDNDNVLVASCARYIRNMTQWDSPHASQASTDQETISVPPASDAVQVPGHSSHLASGDFLQTIPPNAGNLEPFQLLPSEIFDPSVFEEFGPSGESSNTNNALWDAFMPWG